MTTPPEAPQDSKLAIPRHAYFSQQWYEREQDELFGRCWAYAAMVVDVANPGDYQCVQVGRHPLVVVRGMDGVLRAFHNICRHRGTAVLSGNGNTGKRMRCPYHHWVYGLDGALIGVSQEREVCPGLDKSRLGLLEAELAVWNGLVFVHPERDAEPFEDWLADLPERLPPYDAESLIDFGCQSYHIRSNWKIFIENFLDNYHLGYVHPETLAGLDHKRQVQHECGRHWSFFEPTVEPGQLTPAEREAGLVPYLPEQWYGSFYGFLFPNFHIVGTASWMAGVHTVPLGPEECRVEVRSRGLLPPNFEELIAAAEQAPADPDEREYGLMEEDIFCCAALQTGVRSPNFSLGPMAMRYECAILGFQKSVADYIRAE